MTKINRILSICRSNAKNALTLFFVCGLLILCVAATKEDAVQRFKSWFKRYQKGEIKLSQPSSVPIAAENGKDLKYFHDDNLKEMDALLDQLARQNDLRATQLLVDAACFRFKRQSEAEIEKYYQEQPWILRAHALEALQDIKDPESIEWLRNRCLKNGTGWESAFRRIIAASLFDTDNMLKDPSLLLSLLDDRDPQVQTKALEGLGRVGGQEELDAVIAMTDHKRPLVRVAALESVGGILARGENSASNLAQQYLPILTRHLDDQEWPVQETILSMMERFRSEKSIPILIDFLERTSLNPEAYRVRIIQRITEVLRSLTGARIQETDPLKWNEWWQENKEGFELAPAPSLSLRGFQLDAPSFFDIPVNSDHVYFILDISGSMRAPLPSQYEQDQDKAETKLDRARKELSITLEALDPDVQFNIILFNDTLSIFSKKPVKASKSAKKKAKAFFLKADADAGTNIFDSLNHALQFKSMGLVDRFEEDLQLDTVFLLSDGVPTAGIVIDPREILRIITQANILSKIKINTIYLGAENNRFMRNLAEQNFGQYIHIR